MAIDQDITNLPTPPSRSDSPSDFSDKADAFLAALPQLQTELNTYADEANATQQVINTSESNAATSETNAEDWASKTDGIVLDTDFSAKAYALGGTGVTDVDGAAKEWAVKTGSTVDGSEYSAKDYAISLGTITDGSSKEWAVNTGSTVDASEYSAKDYASSQDLISTGSSKDWAIKTGGTVDGTDFSAKKYANDAQSSADAAASLAGATAWSAGVTYDTNDAAIGSDGNTYRSLVDGNLGNDPVTGDGTKWLNLTGTADVTKAELTKTFAAGESASLTLSEEVTTAPVVSVTKEVPQTGVTSNDWDVASDGANYTLHDTAYDTTLTPSNATGGGTFTLGTGSFAAEDVGKRIVGNGGEAILTAADGSYELQTAFNDTSTIATGDWSMFALDVESADAGLTLSGTSISFNFTDADSWSYDSVSLDVSGQDEGVRGIEVSNDGTKLYLVGENSDSVYQYTLSTPFDLSTASYDSVSFSVSGQMSNPYSITFNNDGTKMYVVGQSNGNVFQYTLTSAFDLSTASYDNISFDFGEANPRGFTFNNDGTSMYVIAEQTGSAKVLQWNLSTPFDLTTTSLVSGPVVQDQVGGQYGDIRFNNDGTKLFIASLTNDAIYQYTLTTPFDIFSLEYNGVFFDVSGQDTSPQGITFNSEGSKLYVVGDANNSIYQYTTGSTSFFFPTSTNHTAITTASTDTEFWVDINSMTADDESNDGSVYYAVSTDDRTTWSIIDDTNGVRNIVRNNGGTWEVNVSEDVTGFDITNAEENSFFELDPPNISGASGAVLNSNGTKMFIVDNANSTNAIYEFSLATPYDLSTMSYNNVSFDLSSTFGQPISLAINNDDTKLFIGNSGFNSGQYAIYEMVMSVANDISTLSHNGVTLDTDSVSGSNTLHQDIIFSPDGTKMLFCVFDDIGVYEYDLSTPFDLSSATYSGNKLVQADFSISFSDEIVSISFNDTGTKLFVADKSLALNGQRRVEIYQFSLSSPYSISSISYDNINYIKNIDDKTLFSLIFKPNGEKMFAPLVPTPGSSDNLTEVVEFQTSSISYTTEEQWQPSAINDEFSALEEAADVTTVNRMDATQLNAVSDANHYTLGNDLDLAITLFMADGNTSSPTSDGVAINYDANVVNQGAVLGTDYEFDKPTNTTVRVTALSDENLKVRVL